MGVSNIQATSDISTHSESQVLLVHRYHIGFIGARSWYINTSWFVVWFDTHSKFRDLSNGKFVSGWVLEIHIT